MKSQRRKLSNARMAGLHNRISKKEWLESQMNELEYWAGIVCDDGESGRCEYYLNKFEKYLENADKKIAVDVGAGPRGILRLIHCKVGIAIDSLMQDYETSGYSFEDQRFIPIKSTGENIPLLDNYADYIFSTNALDHVRDAGKVFKEMVRILKPRGRLFLIVDLRSREQIDKYHKICLNDTYFERLGRKYKLELIDKHVEDSVSMRGLKSWIGVFEKPG